MSECPYDWQRIQKTSATLLKALYSAPLAIGSTGRDALHAYIVVADAVEHLHEPIDPLSLITPDAILLREPITFGDLYSADLTPEQVQILATLRQIYWDLSKLFFSCEWTTNCNVWRPGRLPDIEEELVQRLRNALGMLDGSIKELDEMTVRAEDEQHEPVNLNGGGTGKGKAQPVADGATETKPKRLGRRKSDYLTVQREAQLAADWARARDSGVYKPDFAKDQKMTLKEFDRLLDRVAGRNRHSE